MTKNGHATVHMAILLDESGSMAGKQQAVIDGTNEFVGSLLNEQTEDEVKVSLTMFDWSPPDESVRVRWDGKALADVPQLTSADYKPRGLTPLNDAVVEALERVSKQMADGDRAMLIVFTDGLENKSETRSEAVKELVERKEKEGWAFIYLGAEQDAWQQQDSALGMGAAGQSFTTVTTPGGTRSAMTTASSLASTYTSSPDKYAAAAAATPKHIPEDAPEQPKAKSKSEQVTQASSFLRRKSS